MRTISLEKLAIRNFRSFVQDDIHFSKTKGLIFLTGRNDAEPGLGPNGCGKSALWDAVCWNAYGTSMRGGRWTSLIGWGQETTEVTADWNVDSIVHTIKRYGPPMRVELDGKPSTQEAINTLLGLDRSRFIHSVIFGQNTLLFPDLPITERGDLLDQVLSLSIWQLAADKAGQRSSELEAELNEKKVLLSFVKGQLDSIQSDDAIVNEILNWDKEKENNLLLLRKMEDQWYCTQEANIKQNRIDYSIWEEDFKTSIANLQVDEESWKSQVVDKSEDKIQLINFLEAELAPLEYPSEIRSPQLIEMLAKNLKGAEQLRDQEREVLTKINIELSSCVRAEGLWKETVCPTCNQKITESKKEHELQCIEKVRFLLNINKTVTEQKLLKIETDIASFSSQLIDLRAIESKNNEKQRNTQREIARIKAAVGIAEHEAKKLLHELEGTNPYTTQIANFTKQSNPYKQQLLSLQAQVNPYISQIQLSWDMKNPFEEKLQTVKQERKRLTDEYTKVQNEYNGIEAKIVAVQYWKHGFKRIRLYFIQQVSAALEIEIQSSISALGLQNWGLKLVTEKVTKSDTIHLGIQIIVKSPKSEGPWDGWSGGETQRLRLGIAMGLGSLIQRASGVFYPLEVFDEQSKSLSNEGVEDLLEALRNRSESMKKQIWITDHSNLQFSGFDKVMCAVINSNGSHIVKC